MGNTECIGCCEEISGIGLAECDSIPDAVDHVVSWSGISDLSVFSNKPIRLKFEMNETKLYAFEFAGRKN